MTGPGAPGGHDAPAETGRVLVVDDEAPMRRALEINLEARGYDVCLAASGEEALSVAARRHPDVVLLDLGLPGISGIEVIEGLRGWTKVPIIVVSARDEEFDKVAALDAGADDYVSKPFGMDELLARLRATLRRTLPDDSGEAVVAVGDLAIDLVDKRVRRDGAEIHLTPTEWRLLELVVRNRGRLVTQRQLLLDVWGPGFEEETGYLRVHVGNLRRKIEPDPSRPRYLLTEPGMGYRFHPGGADS